METNYKLVSIEWSSSMVLSRNASFSYFTRFRATLDVC